MSFRLALALALVTMIGALLAAAIAAAVEPPGTPRSREALVLCRRVDGSPEHERAALIEQSLTLAEAAVDANENDAVAHLAVFCAIGRQMKEEGPSAMTLWKIRRLRVELDRTLELAPDYPDALLGKGSLLIRLPRMLGGDPEEGERLMRRALALDPDFANGRLEMARALAEIGRRDEAYTEAVAAAQAAERANDAALAAEARRFANNFGPPSGAK